jgi:hypothetical protein
MLAPMRAPVLALMLAPMRAPVLALMLAPVRALMLALMLAPVRALMLAPVRADSVAGSRRRAQVLGSHSAPTGGTGSRWRS